MIFKNCSRAITALTISLVMVCSTPSRLGLRQQSDQHQQILEATGHAFIEAEAKSYIEKLANAHPPINGMQGFGTSAMFAVQLLLAADNYLKADTDKQRFHAVEQGATAYIAFAYAATPAVGLAVTAVVLVTGIIEGAVASSYAEAQLAFYKDMQTSQLRINDLEQRFDRANAMRFIAAIDEAQRIVGELDAVNKKMILDCKQRPSDFAALGGCLTLLVQQVTLREQEVRAVGALLQWPDEMLGLLVSGREENKGKKASDLGKPARTELETVRKQTYDQLIEVQKVYDKFVADYRTLAVQMIFDEALAEAQRLEAINQVKQQCFVDDTALSFSAAKLVYQITSERAQRLSKKKNKSKGNAKQMNTEATSLLENFEQRRVSCPVVAADTDLSKLMDIVRDRLKGL